MKLSESASILKRMKEMVKPKRNEKSKNTPKNGGDTDKKEKL